MPSADVAPEQRVGQLLAGRWILRKLVGTGGMASVYAADDPSGQLGAVKILNPEMGHRQDLRERFLREAAVMARIAHPNMVAILDQGESQGLTYLVMELLDGETIAERVRRAGPFPPMDVLTILHEVLDVLDVAHRLGVVHRDLKPENLFLTRDGRVKVLDFGLARLLDAGPDSLRTRTGAALGTLPYMAPEQALGRREEIDGRTDLFSLGATAFRLLTGRRIHEAPSDAELLMRMATEPAPYLAVVAPHLAPEIGLVVDRSLAFDRNQRYPDALTMQRDVDALKQGQAPPYAATRHRILDAPTVSERIPRAAGAQPRPLPPTIALSASSSRTAAPIASMPASQRVLPPTVTAAATPPQAPSVSASTPQRALPPTVSAPASQRALPPTVSAPASQRALPPTVSAPASQRALPPTVAMMSPLQPMPNLATATEQQAALEPPAARLPSYTAREGRRRFTFWTAVGLVICTASAIAAALAYYFANSTSPASPAPTTATLPANQSTASVAVTQGTRARPSSSIAK